MTEASLLHIRGVEGEMWRVQVNPVNARGGTSTGFYRQSWEGDPGYTGDNCISHIYLRSFR